MPSKISKFSQDTYQFECLPTYTFEVSSVPPRLATNSSLRADFDDRSIALPAELGSIWVRVYTEEDGLFVAHAVFAVGSESVICDDVQVNEAHQDQDMATSCYDIAGIVAGSEVQPSTIQTTDAKKFWQKRNARTDKD